MKCYDTDGNGRLIEAERSATVYGVPRDRLYAEERPTIVKQDHSRRRAARNSKIDTLAAMIATYPGKTARELCELTGFGHPAMQDYLRALRDDGTVTVTAPQHTEFGHNAPFTYRIEGAV